MGNKISIKIALDNDNVHRAGEQLKGKVIVKQNRPFAVGSHVKLIFIGKERTIIQKRNGKHKCCAPSSERIFFSFRKNISLSSGNRIRLAGHFVYPFTLDLPSNLPSSFGIRDDAFSNSGAELQYALQAVIGTATAATTQLVKIEALPLPRSNNPLMMEPKSYPVSGFFGRKGSVTTGVKVDRTLIGRGENLNLHVACSNDSTAQIERVQVKIYEQVDWKTEDKNRSRTMELLSVRDLDLPGLSKNRKGRAEVRRSDDARRRRDIYRSIHSELLSGQSRISLPIPPNARDSYKGHLITVSHRVEITFQTVGMANNPVTSFPIEIGPPGAVNQPASVRPPTEELFYAQPPPLNPSSMMQDALEEPEYVRPPPEQPEYMQSPGDAYLPPLPVSHATPAPSYAVTPVVRPVPNHVSDHIPIVCAVALPGDAMEPHVDAAEEEIIVLGQEAILAESTESPSIPPTPAPSDSTSLSSLIRIVASCSSRAPDAIESRLRDSSWLELFRNLSPEEYGSIIAHVGNDFDQTQIATMLAFHVNGGGNFTCRYAAAAIRSSSEWNRGNMAQRLLPLCKDVAREHNLIRRELSEWELVVTSRDFEDAICNAGAAPQ